MLLRLCVMGCALLLPVAWPLAVSADVVNGNFESGLTGWSQPVFVSTPLTSIVAESGNHYVKIAAIPNAPNHGDDAGNSLYQDIAGIAGKKLVFDWSASLFIPGAVVHELVPSGRATATITVTPLSPSGAAFTITRTIQDNGHDDLDPLPLAATTLNEPWQGGEYRLPANGTYRIQFDVSAFPIGNMSRGSSATLLVDNVAVIPEPSGIVLAILGLALATACAPFLRGA